MQLRRSAQLQQHSNSKLTPLYTKKLADLFVSLSISSNFTIKRRHFYFISHVNWILFVEFTPSNSTVFSRRNCVFHQSNLRILQIVIYKTTVYSLTRPNLKTKSKKSVFQPSSFLHQFTVELRTRTPPAKIFKRVTDVLDTIITSFVCHVIFARIYIRDLWQNFFLNFGHSGTTSYVI